MIIVNVDRLLVGWLDGFQFTTSTGASGRGAVRAKDAPETPTQSHTSPSIIVHED